jgi:hypothetical protein
VITFSSDITASLVNGIQKPGNSAHNDHWINFASAYVIQTASFSFAFSGKNMTGELPNQNQMAGQLKTDALEYPESTS